MLVHHMQVSRFVCVQIYPILSQYHRDDEKKKAKTGARTGWYTGVNSSCRRHIASLHYTEYSKRCKAAKIEEKAAATPKSVLEQRKQEVERKKKQAKQTTLDGVARKIETPTEFSRSSILDAVTKHVVVGDQVCYHPT